MHKKTEYKKILSDTLFSNKTWVQWPSDHLRVEKEDKQIPPPPFSPPTIFYKWQAFTVACLNSWSALAVIFSFKSLQLISYTEDFSKHSVLSSGLPKKFSRICFLRSNYKRRYNYSSATFGWRFWIKYLKYIWSFT